MLTLILKYVCCISWANILYMFLSVSGLQLRMDFALRGVSLDKIMKSWGNAFGNALSSALYIVEFEFTTFKVEIIELCVHFEIPHQLHNYGRRLQLSHHETKPLFSLPVSSTDRLVPLDYLDDEGC